MGRGSVRNRVYCHEVLQWIQETLHRDAEAGPVDSQPPDEACPQLSGPEVLLLEVRLRCPDPVFLLVALLRCTTQGTGQGLHLLRQQLRYRSHRPQGLQAAGH